LQIDGPAEEFSEAYLFQTPRKTNLLPGALEVIAYLSKKYPLYVLTNGFNDIQWVKIEGAGMRHFFQEIITSEVAGHKKPALGFFDYALKIAGVTPDEALMVGDHPIVDIQGAAEAGIKGIHLNLRTDEKVCQNQILDLRELLDLIA
jgi:putative hydrolase of the HAD superfamily